MNAPAFPTIAERRLELKGPADRFVYVRIGAPEPSPDSGSFPSFRCPFQIEGLSNDAIRFAMGVDSFQALNLAFAGIRAELRTNASVLAAFHKDFALTWEGHPWQTAIPVWLQPEGEDEEQELHTFKEELWKRRAALRSHDVA